MSGDDNPEIIIHVKPSQKSVTIKCPECGEKILKVTCKGGLADCTDWSTCRECGHQFGWKTEVKQP